MSTIEKTIGASREKKLDIRLGRVLLAAVLAEAAVILVLVAITQTYSLFIAPGLTNAEYSEFGQLAGYYVAPVSGAVSTFAMVLWLARALKSNFVANGILTGVAGVLLTVGFLATAKPEHRLMYLISFVLRIVGGYLGGLVSQKRAEFGKRDAH